MIALARIDLPRYAPTHSTYEHGSTSGNRQDLREVQMEGILEKIKLLQLWENYQEEANMVADKKVKNQVKQFSIYSLGWKKRKKKTYTKPKKIKHKKKKVKLAVLQFYKVDDAGKVQRLRKECPNAECGAGTFMANHFDRHYCGKCGLTYVYQKAGGD
ncbi:hypothetical protein TEA_025235 [Camellia sinensis var. sinensis]|uniref:Small ribosomal subunit protein eS31 domain-containing protein n=1 Tax=Camellia sinensis var. sinensis TaxID=542762 RepID=A0A4S4EZZ2_CAMSN|nr:hypothetical protein TEA_025235 [Camellia sinensis var. sinensis]